MKKKLGGNMSTVRQIMSGLGGTLSSLTPEPKNGNGISFGSVLDTVGDVAGSMIGIDPGYASLLQTQMHMQQQMQQVSLVSNIMRSKHESKMAAIRNVRTG